MESDRPILMVLIDPEGATHPPPDIDGYAVATSAEEAIALGEAAIGFILSGDDLQLHERTALALRQSPHWLKPIFTLQKNDHPLLDGQMGLSIAYVTALRMRDMLGSLRLDVNALQLDERLLAFLYVRDSGLLRPQFERRHKALYTYPIANALALPAQDPQTVIDDLVKRRLLLERDLIDRTRNCRKCGCAHQNYIDICPNCASIAIHKALALHCFTCGHVGPENDFNTPKGMTCPQCQTRLRHIGVDYDRPLTQYACKDCHHVFIEPDIVARCLDCGVRTPPDALEPREIYALSISAHGRTALRAGRLDESFAAIDIPNFVVSNYFMRLLDWALAAQQRHPDLDFGLVLLDIRNAPHLFSELGFQRTYALFDELARRLSELLRDSDVVTRTQEYRLWVFLPMSDPMGFIQRLNTTLADLTRDLPVNMETHIVGMRTPQDITPDQTADTLIDQLEAMSSVE